MNPTSSDLNYLNEQLLDAATEFSTDAEPLGKLLTSFVQDIARGLNEPLELFPVCHHSPASALHLVQRLHERQPKVIYMEMCEDMLGLIENLTDCKLPVAFQAFASESETFPPEWMPASVVAPLTEASAEYQAIAYVLQHPETELVFVDRAADYIFQWEPLDQKAADQSQQRSDEKPSSEDAKMHGSAIGIEIGSLVPTFDRFLEFLLHNSNTRHFAEWWDQYVEQAIIGADYQTYRQVMFLIGSLIRRLGRKDKDNEVDRLRERYMWTRMKQHMAQNKIAPNEAIHICGAAHTASDVEEFGFESNVLWEIPERTKTEWLFGLLPSSFAAIEYQFGHPAGTASLAEDSWKKALRAAKVKPFTLQSSRKKSKATKAKRPSASTAISAAGSSSNLISTFLTRPPELAQEDSEQLLNWSVRIVALARKNGYLASTADSIAIYETAILLANMRSRRHPTPYDFQDAAITCLEKDRTPKKRNIAQICQILLGGDRVGTVGYTSLPPLAQNIYDRLKPLGFNLSKKTNERALMDIKQQPELLDCSEVLWRLHYLLGNYVVEPIMGERKLIHQPIQESWEVRIGKSQGSVIQLGYEGVTLEQVLEQRMKATAFSDDATATKALAMAEDSVMYLSSPRLTRELGLQAKQLLIQETGAEDAPHIFERVRRLVHHYRATPTGLPEWIQQFVATGYAHYTTLLPQTFADRGTKPEQIAGMLGFIFTLESLALSLGCQRSQLLISVQQIGQRSVDPAKLGLLWTTEWLLNLRSITEIRQFFNEVLSNPMRLPTFPEYLNGFILSLTFAPRIALFVVELLSHLFGDIPDEILLPWLPSLILQLRQHSPILQPLIKEASASFPKSLAGFAGWEAPWLIDAQATPTQKAVQVELNEQEMAVRTFLFGEPTTANAFAKLLGMEEAIWQLELLNDEPSKQLSVEEKAVQSFLFSAPETMNALVSLWHRN